VPITSKVLQPFLSLGINPETSLALQQPVGTNPEKSFAAQQHVDASSEQQPTKNDSEESLALQQPTQNDLEEQPAEKDSDLEEPPAEKDSWKALQDALSPVDAFPSSAVEGTQRELERQRQKRAREIQEEQDGANPTRIAMGIVQDCATVAYAFYSSEMWGAVMRATKGGTGNHDKIKQDPSMMGTAADWIIMGVAAAVLFELDIYLLQQLPETPKVHVSVLVFWILIAAAFWMETSYRLGPQAGVYWVSSYILDFACSFDSIFMLYVTVCTYEVPQRLLSKILFVNVLFAILFRTVLLVAPPILMDSLTFVPVVVGIGLVYCGVAQMTLREDDVADITRHPTLAPIKRMLGDRMCEFYDEDAEGFFIVLKGKLCVTMLAVVALSFFFLNFMFALDAVWAKTEIVPSKYINVNSSLLACFTLRALCSLLRDVLSWYSLARYAAGIIITFCGLQTLMSRMVYVNVLVSSIITVLILATSVGTAILRKDPSSGEDVKN